MLCEEYNSVASRAQFSNIFIILFDVFGFGRGNEGLFLDEYRFFLHKNQLQKVFELIIIQLLIKSLMNSATQLQKRVELITDQINDIFHATSLNLEALTLQLRTNHESKITESHLIQCQQQFENIKYLFQQRANLRLEYLITQQIKQEQSKVRRERLSQYQEKIYDQRRLISDKEVFYEGLLKPRKKRPAHMSIEEFHSKRKQQISQQQKQNVKRLQQETNELKTIGKAIEDDNEILANMLKQMQNQDLPEQQLEALSLAIEKNPIIYDYIKPMTCIRLQKQQTKRLYENIKQMSGQTDAFYKQYMQQKELHKHLRWQNQKLKAEYLKKNQERQQAKTKIIKRLSQLNKYKTSRSFSI